MLLILDNFEHVIDATPLVARILHDTRSVKMLITSRERLQIQGEWVYPILGLTFPTPDAHDNFESYGAVQLFLEGAGRSNPQFAVKDADKVHIARVCELVQGMPLGVELASAWMGTLTPHEIADEIARNQDFLATEMHGIPERHRSLRAVFEYSWHLLTQPEREMFMKLSVFQGGFSRVAARDVINASVRSLETLLNKSLIRRDDLTGRYLVVDALREYISEKLHEHSELESQIRLTHAQFFLGQLNSVKSDLRGGEQKQALQSIDQEIENIRRAWNTACELHLFSNIEAALSSLALFYEMKSWFTEGEELIRRARMAIESQSDDAAAVSDLRAKLLTREGAFIHRLGRSEDAERLLKISLEILETSDDSYDLALIYNNLGNLAYVRGMDELAIDFHKRSLDLRTALGDAWSIATSLSNLGVLEARLDHLERARELFEQSLTHRRAIEDRFGIATSLNNLGVIASQLGDFERAREIHRESLEIRRELEDQKGITESLSNLGVIADALGEYDASISLYEESLEISESIGDKYSAARTMNNLGYAAFNLGEYTYALEFCNKGLELNREIQNQAGIVLSLNGLANSASELGKLEQAERYFIEALQISSEFSKKSDLLEILWGLSRLYAHQDETEQSVRILHCVIQHPNTDLHTKTNAQSLLDGISGSGSHLDTQTPNLDPEAFLTAIIGELIQG